MVLQLSKFGECCIEHFNVELKNVEQIAELLGAFHVLMHLFNHKYNAIFRISQNIWPETLYDKYFSDHSLKVSKWQIRSIETLL